MPVRTFDFTGTGGGFEPWPEEEGVPFTIFNIEYKNAKSSGQPMVVFEFKHVGSNRKAWRNFSLQPQALWGLKEFLVNLGIDETELEGKFDFDSDEFLGEEVELYFSAPREFNGREVQDVIHIATS